MNEMRVLDACEYDCLFERIANMLCQYYHMNELHGLDAWLVRLFDLNELLTCYVNILYE